VLRIAEYAKRGGFRGYSSAGDRRRAVAALIKCGFNYFVGYHDTQSRFALNYGNADWVKSQPYMKVYKKDI
jgi:hypothetical protein